MTKTSGTSSLRIPSKPDDEEFRISLPRPLRLPKYHGPSSNREDLEVQGIIVLLPDKFGNLTVYRRDGHSFTLSRQEDIPKLFPEKFNFTYSKFNEIDCITRVLNKKQRASLELLHRTPISVDGTVYNLFWIPGTAKFRLQVGGNTKSSRFLINLSNFTPSKYTHPMTNPLKDIEFIAGEFVEFHRHIPMNFLSPASTTKDVVLDSNGREFSTFEELVNTGAITPDDLDIFHSIYRGGRQETSVLGTFEGQSGDLEKAYLMELGECPGIFRNVLGVYRGTQALPDAHPGSWYKVRVKIPLMSDSSFPPMPFRLDLTYYPVGEFTSYVSKPYVEMLQESNTHFTILDSCQIQLQSLDRRPFRELAQTLRYFEDTFKEKLALISVKSLHFPIVGHFLSMHEVVEEGGDTYWETTQDYNPLFASAIQGSVAKRIWETAQVNDSIATATDKVYGRNLVLGKGFKPIEEGLHTFLTPSLKDDPGKSTYRDLIERYRDKSKVVLRYTGRVSFTEGCVSNTTGRLINYSVNIPPTSGNRYLKRGIRRVGELLDGEKLTTVPSIDRLLREGSTCLLKVPAEKIEQYLRSIQQTQT